MVAQLCKEYSVQGETIYHAVWSNQCVELWYLLHFMYMDTDIDKISLLAEAERLDEKHWCRWLEKNRPDMYEVLRPYMDIAIANAKRWTSKTKDGSRLNQHPERKSTNWLRC